MNVIMKHFYSIDGYCNEQFPTLFALKAHLELYSTRDLLGADGYYIYRYIAVDDEHSYIDTTFCRRINVKSDGSKFRFTKVSSPYAKP